MYTFLFRFDISHNLNGPVSGGLNDCRSLVKLLHWRTADGETAKRRARDGRGNHSEGGRSERVGNQSWLLWPATPRAFLAQITRDMSQYPSYYSIGLTLTFGSNGSWFKPWMGQITRGGNHLEGGRPKLATMGSHIKAYFLYNYQDKCLNIPYFNTPTCHNKFTGVIPELSKKLSLTQAREPFGRGSEREVETKVGFFGQPHQCHFLHK